jgi:hypothetical protein
MSTSRKDSTAKVSASMKAFGTSARLEPGDHRKRKGGDFIERSGGILISSSTLASLPVGKSLDIDLPSRRSIKRDLHTEQSLRRTFNADLGRSDMFFLCPDVTCQPLHCLVGDDDIGSTMPQSSPPRFLSQKIDIFQVAQESPTSILNGANREPSSVHFWRRSMAWDDSWSSDEDEGSEGRGLPQSVIREKLRVPEMQQVMAARHTPAETRLSKSRSPRPPIRRIRRLSNRDPADTALDIFRGPKTQKSTSEIYWEEKLEDAFDLERMAKLSLS